MKSWLCLIRFVLIGSDKNTFPECTDKDSIDPDKLFESTGFLGYVIRSPLLPPMNNLPSTRFVAISPDVREGTAPSTVDLCIRIYSSRAIVNHAFGEHLI